MTKDFWVLAATAGYEKAGTEDYVNYWALKLGGTENKKRELNLST